MYRLLGFQSVTNARLLLNHRKVIESNNKNFSLLFNNYKSLLTPKGEFNRVSPAAAQANDFIEENRQPHSRRNLEKTCHFNPDCFCFLLIAIPAGGVFFPCYSSNGISPEMLKILTKKKKKKYKKYTELLQGK